MRTFKKKGLAVLLLAAGMGAIQASAINSLAAEEQVSELTIELEEERELLNLLDKLNKKGIKFALSNVLQKKKLNIKNEILYNWLEKNKDKYFINEIEYHYRSASYNKKNRDGLEEEVLITNYKVEE